MEPVKTDITNSSDIKVLVDSFYSKVVVDPVIGFIFTEVIEISWEHHMPVMYTFWESVLLGTGTYRGNPIMKHIDLDKKVRLELHHFTQWKELFYSTIDELFEGQTATLAKERVAMMEPLIRYKIQASRNDGFIQ